MMTQPNQLARWRLILGAESQPALTGMGALSLSQEELLMDSALNESAAVQPAAS